MNLIIDVGNTAIKWAVFKAQDLVFKTSELQGDFKENAAAIFKEFPEIVQVIVSSVGHLPESDISWLKQRAELLVLNHETKLPFQNKYKTPKTLGVDRLALVSAATAQFPQKNVLVIDAGTCITYDFLSSEGVYFGGAISPGVNMRYQALNAFTAKLPLLEKALPESCIGNTTNQAIHAGVVCGVLNEIDGFIEKYRRQYPDLTVILTGGDANFLSKQLKSSIFANSNFLLEGLNHILRFNLT
ncbi:MAG: type III pantothenate kinase [Algicola sp.]|nr:type III pantothenate kinase [Algicola sp.]